MQQQQQLQDNLIYEKQRLKERDGFCRRVDTYDGNVLVVDQKPTYEIGNYLGGGVAGVVYQGHRLLPLKEYPVRMGVNDEPVDLHTTNGAGEDIHGENGIETEDSNDDGVFVICGPVNCEGAEDTMFCGGDDTEYPGEETASSPMSTDLHQKTKIIPTTNSNTDAIFQEAADVAIEATMTQNENVVMLDAQDAPSRSKHFSQAAGVKMHPKSDQRSSENFNHGLTDEAVAIKILNPVGYRILQSEGLKGAVVVQKGDPMDPDVKKGNKPMTDKHVWWMVNPNSRNLRTLQRYNGKDKTMTTTSNGGGANANNNNNSSSSNDNNNNNNTKSVQVDRGSKEKGLRLSLIPAYVDPRTNQLRELTLTRCIEIWGHVPFNVTDLEFEDVMTAIERVNAGQSPPPIHGLDVGAAAASPRSTVDGHGRVGTDATGTTGTTMSSDDPMSPVAFQTART